MIENEFLFDIFGNSITIRFMQENKKFITLEIGLFVVTFLFWVIWFAKAYIWVEYKDRQASVLGTILIALAVVMLAVVYILFRLARPSYILVKKKKKMVILMISALVVIGLNFFMLYRYRDYGYTISTVAQITGKESEGGKFYFQIADSENGEIIRLVCDEKTYMALKEDQGVRYSIQYRRLTFGKKKAVLGYLDIVNTITEGSDKVQES